MRHDEIFDFLEWVQSGFNRLIETGDIFLYPYAADLQHFIIAAGWPDTLQYEAGHMIRHEFLRVDCYPPGQFLTFNRSTVGYLFEGIRLELTKLRKEGALFVLPIVTSLFAGLRGPDGYRYISFYVLLEP